MTATDIGQKTRYSPPLSYVSRVLNMWVGLRKCKNCNTWNVVVFVGQYYFERGAFAYYPNPSLNLFQGKVGIEVSSWVLTKMKEKNLKIPEQLQKEMETQK